ncbi:hypothetical protein VE00_02384 [Pseudogymnoascus sp. WSF 3629]|nr:hypothetical protein VE00_02384 [Pseudogymnoascus sp. WSF 3629]
MRFTTAFIASAFMVLAAAQSLAANPFTNTDYTSISAGKAFTITWSPTTTGPVSLVLVKGDPAALTTVSTIASGLDNSGSFSWTPNSSIVKGSNYALKIVDDADATVVNYTLQFPIDSAGTDSSAAASVVASTTVNDAGTKSTPLDIKTSTKSTVPDITTSTTDASPTNASTAEDSTTLATVTTPNESSSAFSAPDNSATTKPSASSTQTSKSSTVSQSSSAGAAGATGAANVCAGLMGFVGAAVILL